MINWKTIFIIFVFLPLLIFCSKKATPPECGVDANCFLKAASTCQPATLLLVQSKEFSGQIGTHIDQLEIIGKEGDRCLLSGIPAGSSYKYTEEERRKKLQKKDSSGKPYYHSMEEILQEEARSKNMWFGGQNRIKTMLICEKEPKKVTHFVKSYKGPGHPETDREDCRQWHLGESHERALYFYENIFTNRCSGSYDCPTDSHCHSGECLSNQLLLSKSTCGEEEGVWPPRCTELCQNCDEGTFICLLDDMDDVRDRRCVECKDYRDCKDGHECKNYQCVALK